MSMMKDLYDEGWCFSKCGVSCIIRTSCVNPGILYVLKFAGDDSMKKIIGEAMYKARQAEIAQDCMGLSAA